MKAKGQGCARTNELAFSVSPAACSQRSSSAAGARHVMHAMMASLHAKAFGCSSVIACVIALSLSLSLSLCLSVSLGRRCEGIASGMRCSKGADRRQCACKHQSRPQSGSPHRRHGGHSNSCRPVRRQGRLRERLGDALTAPPRRSSDGATAAARAATGPSVGTATAALQSQAEALCRDSGAAGVSPWIIASLGGARAALKGWRFGLKPHTMHAVLAVHAARDS